MARAIFGTGIAAVLLGCASSKPGAYDPSLGAADAGSAKDAAGGILGGDTPPTQNGPAGGCDGETPTELSDAKDFAKAIGLCKVADGSFADDWGLISARLENGFGAATAPGKEQVGSLGKFGNKLRPREGSKLAVLSTGYALEYNGKSGASFKTGGKPPRAASGVLPEGYPKASKSCGLATDVHDVAGVHLEVKAPKNATGVSFDFNFFSSEWPEFVCSSFNDGFLAFVRSKAKTDNISFDKQGNPVSVNNGFFDRCTPGTPTGCAGGQNVTLSLCPGGGEELGGTGFEAPGTYCAGKVSVGGGATGWLTSKLPLQGGEVFEIDFLIWNTGDTALDSSVLIDNFTFIVDGPVEIGTDRPPIK